MKSFELWITKYYDSEGDAVSLKGLPMIIIDFSDFYYYGFHYIVILTKDMKACLLQTTDPIRIKKDLTKKFLKRVITTPYALVSVEEVGKNNIWGYGPEFFDTLQKISKRLLKKPTRKRTQ